MELRKEKSIADLEKNLRTQRVISIITLLFVFLITGFTIIIFLNNKGVKEASLVENLFDAPDLDFLNKDSTATGQPILTSDVTPCLKLYDSIMRRYGIDTVVKHVNITTNTTMMVTSEECFRGKELGDFLRKAAKDKAFLLNKKKHLAVRVVLGIYTDEYLNKNVPDPKQRALKKNRIAIFLVTRKWKEGNIWVPLTKEDLENGDDDIAFDLGEINPPPKP